MTEIAASMPGTGDPASRASDPPARPSLTLSGDSTHGGDHPERTPGEDDLLAVRYQQASNSEDFRLLYDRYYARMFSIAYRRVGRFDVAEDVVQDSWRSYLRHRGYDPEQSAFRSFLFLILERALATHFRKQVRRPDAHAEQAEMVEAAGCSSWTMGLTEAEDLLRSCGLAEPEVALMMQKYVLGEKWPEISQRTGTDPSTLRSRAQTIRSKIKATLESRNPRVPGSSTL